jgi:GNAT superfamily N-acetyltransferase
MPTLRSLDARDIDALVAVQRATAGTAAPATREQLAEQLTDPARGNGRNVVVADRGGAAVGVAGWVEAGDRMFGAPVLAAEPAVADRLVGHLIERGRTIGAVTLRIGAGDGEPAKLDALRRHGFAPVLDFVLVARSTAPLAAPALSLERRPLAAVAVAALRALENETFAGVDNAPPMSDAEVAHLVDRSWPEASGAWIAADGALAGFAVALRSSDGARAYVENDSIGVRAPWRRRGLSTAMLAHMLDVARSAGVAEARALIASTNQASLALHARAGFAERSRRSMWERVL